MSFIKCDKCGGYYDNAPSLSVSKIPLKEHWCKLRNVVDDEGDESQIWATSEEAAVELWATNYNECGDYTLMDSTVTVIVDGTPYSVTAEASIDYFVKEHGE